MHFRNASAAAGLIAAAVLLPHEPAAQSPTEATTSTQTVAEATTPSMMVVTPQTGGSNGLSDQCRGPPKSQSTCWPR